MRLFEVIESSVRSEVISQLIVAVHRCSESAECFNELKSRFEVVDPLAGVFAEPREARSELAEILCDGRLLHS